MEMVLKRIFLKHFLHEDQKLLFETNNKRYKIQVSSISAVLPNDLNNTKKGKYSYGLMVESTNIVIKNEEIQKKKSSHITNEDDYVAFFKELGLGNNEEEVSEIRQLYKSKKILKKVDILNEFMKFKECGCHAEEIIQKFALLFK